MKATTAALCLTLLAASAWGRPPFEYHFQFSSGEAFGFIGDETVYDGRFTQYVENFFYTRYPDRQLIFYNAGNLNDTAADVLERLEPDIVDRRLNYAIVMLGTWDGEFRDFSMPHFELYRQNMTELLDRMKRARIHPFLMSPPMFDRQARLLRNDDETYRFRLKPVADRYNGVMGYYSSWLREEAVRRGIRFMDGWGTLNTVTYEQRKTNPSFSLVPDSVHPDAGGAAVLASEVIATLAPERKDLGSVVLSRDDAEEGWESRASNARVTDLSGSRRQVSFLWNSSSLPWAMPPEAMFGVEAARIDERFNAQSLRVTGLEPGPYELRIAGELMSRRYSHRELEAGIALHQLRERPQYQRALRVVELNERRYRNVIRPLRDLWQEVKRTRVNYPHDDARIEAVMKEILPKTHALRQRAKDDAIAIYEAAKPLTRRFELRRYFTPEELEAARKREEEAKAKAAAEADAETPGSTSN